MFNELIQGRFKNYKYITGVEEASLPEMVKFRNSEIACEMLNKHINMKSKIMAHGDVDVDGIGSTYIISMFLTDLGCYHNTRECINKNKIHGVTEKHIEYFNNNNFDLVIILDSGTNDIEIIKQFECDVIVVDHHEVLHAELCGDTAKGKYIIVSNMVDSLDGLYEVEHRMSGALVLYETLRVYQVMYNTVDILSNRLLMQWVGVTLFTDAVGLDTERNQWYIANTVNTLNIESGLKVLMNKTRKYQTKIDKSFISFSLAPTFNRTIRAGKSALALDIALHNQKDVELLLEYKDIQDKICKNLSNGCVEYSDYVLKDISDIDVHKNYCGLLAGKIKDYFNKSTVVYKVVDGVAEGSFRGAYSSLDYRLEVEKCGYFAQGHGPAFGLKVNVDMLGAVISRAVSKESGYDKQYDITAGRIVKRGIVHIDDFESFRRNGLLWKLSVANSRLSSEESIPIIALRDEAVLINQYAKYAKYEVFGQEWLNFEDEIVTDLIELYVEFSDEIKFYVRNKWR